MAKEINWTKVLKTALCVGQIVGTACSMTLGGIELSDRVKNLKNLKDQKDVIIDSVASEVGEKMEA